MQAWRKGLLGVWINGAVDETVFRWLNKLMDGWMDG
jgi:hypothetical protein